MFSVSENPNDYEITVIQNGTGRPVTEIWDAGDKIGALVSDQKATEGEIRAFLRGLNVGRFRGEAEGRAGLQSQLRALINTSS